MTESESAYADYSLAGNIGDISPLPVHPGVFSPFSGIEQNDILGIGIERDGGSSGDTYLADFDIVRVDFELEISSPARLRIRPWTKRIRVSDLRHRAVLEEQLLVPDGIGGTSQNWSAIDQFWIDIKPMSVHEIEQAALVGSVVDTRIFMRDPGDLTLKFSATGTVSRLMRFVYGNHYYKIIGPIDHGDILELACEEVAPND